VKQSENVGTCVPILIERALRRFLDDLERALESGDFAELHASRIAGKRLRYEIEFFASLLGADGKTAHSILSKLQDRLGFIADATAFDRYYGELLGELSQPDPRRIGLVTRASENRRARAEALVQLRAFWSGDPGGAGNCERLSVSLAAALRSLADSSTSISGPEIGESSTAS
jgi:CHAD domain-containing protein